MRVCCLLIPLLLASSMLNPLSGNLSTAAEDNGRKKVVFVAGRPSHGYGAHEHYAGCLLLAKSLEEHAGFTCEVVKNGWPADASVFDGADAVVFYADGGGGHPVIRHLAEVDALAERGVGIACLHYAVEVPKGDPGDHFLKWIGGYFETHWSVNPHWTARFTQLPDHPITRGVNTFQTHDEWYYHMRFRLEMEGITPILSDLPGEETLRRPDGPHSNNPDVRRAVLEQKQPQVLAWASERPSGQRGFGFTGGHFHWNWGQKDFRKVVLNAIVWVAGGEVPEGGVDDPDPTIEELEENQDYDQPANYDREAIRQRFNLKSSANSL